jgi:hypothetical protein
MNAIRTETTLTRAGDCRRTARGFLIGARIILG